MPRARDLGIQIGVAADRPTNSVLDVAGVGLGHATLVRDEPHRRRVAAPRAPGSPCCCSPRTPTTGRSPPAARCSTAPASAPGSSPPPSGGRVETPVYLTSTMQLGRVYDAACEIALEQDPGVADDVVIPVVAECDDSFLNDCRRCRSTARRRPGRARSSARLARRRRPRTRARSAPAPACRASASRAASARRRGQPEGHTVAVLLLTNFGAARRLTVAGVPVGRLLPPAPAEPPQPGRLVHRRGRHRRAGRRRRLRPAGPADRPRAGADRVDRPPRQRRDLPGRLHDLRASTATSSRTGAPSLPGAGLDPLFEAVVDAAEEAVLDSLLMSPTTVGRDGNTSEGLDPDLVRELLR